MVSAMCKNNIPTLVILAAGRGTRYGGAKQFVQLGTLKKTLMEYNIAHAIESGFTQIVFIIREECEQQLQQQILQFLPKSIESMVVYQSNKNIPKSCVIHPEREKPLGTAHALWCAKKVVKDHFVVINADDYYGADAFHLTQQQMPPKFAFMVGYEIQKTLSKNGGVNRGVCQLSQNNLLISIDEVEKIHIDKANIISGKNKNSKVTILPKNILVSMNFWCFSLEIFKSLEQLLIATFTQESSNDIECYLPNAVMGLIKRQNAEIRVLASHDQWFGVTYAPDSTWVNKKLSELAEQKIFPTLGKSGDCIK